MLDINALTNILLSQKCKHRSLARVVEATSISIDQVISNEDDAPYLNCSLL